MIPTGREVLRARDVLPLAGTQEAIQAAIALLSSPFLILIFR